MRVPFALLILAMATPGCIDDAPGQPGPLPRNEPGDEAFAIAAANWTGDLFLRLEIAAQDGTVCDVDHEASGRIVAHGFYWHAVAQDGTGSVLEWIYENGPGSNVDPSLVVGAYGQVVETKERPVYDLWSAVGTSSNEAQGGGLTYTFVGRNLAPFTSDPGLNDIVDRDGEKNLSNTFRVNLGCNGPYEIQEIRAGAEVHFIQTDSFAAAGEARVYRDRVGTLGSALLQGTLTREIRAESVEVMLSTTRAPAVGALSVSHPGGSDTLLIDPTANAFTNSPVLEVSSGAGAYELTLDWLSVGQGSIIGFLAEAAPVGAFPVLLIQGGTQAA